MLCLEYAFEATSSQRRICCGRKFDILLTFRVFVWRLRGWLVQYVSTGDRFAFKGVRFQDPRARGFHPFDPEDWRPYVAAEHQILKFRTIAPASMIVTVKGGARDFQQWF